MHEQTGAPNGGGGQWIKQQRSSRRRWLHLCVLGGLSGLAGCIGDDEEPGEEPDEEHEEPEDPGEPADGEDDTDEEANGVLVEGGDSHSFDGSGPEVTPEIELRQGVLTVEFTHDGERNFRARMVNIEGEPWEDIQLLNVFRGTDGSSMMAVDGGLYRVDINADGDWTIDIDQPEILAEDVEEAPFETSGSGWAWRGPFRAEGVSEVNATHDGERNFIAWTHDAGGNQSLLINEIGEYEGTNIFRPDEGAFWINIEADGNWSIEIE